MARTTGSTAAEVLEGSRLLFIKGLGRRADIDASERHAMIKDPEFQANGRPIGSGPTEATCKTLTARLKG